MMTSLIRLKGSQIAEIPALLKDLTGPEPAWLVRSREEALVRFSEKGFPTIRQEDWKYTSLEPVFENDYVIDAASARQGLDLHRLQPFLIEEREWPRLVFINGFFSPESSFLPSGFSKFNAGSLREAVANGNCGDRFWKSPASFKKTGVTDFNEAFWTDGFFLHVPDGTVLEKPFHLLFITLPAVTGEKPLSAPRNLVILDRKSRATVIESHVSFGKDVHFSNAVTEIVLEEDADLDHYRIQQESPAAFHVGTTQTDLGPGSLFRSHAFSIGGRISREDLNVFMSHPESACVLKGLYVLETGQHRDHHTLIDHAQPSCRSEQVYKGIIGERSRAVFNGKVLVRQDAQRTDAQQLNKNLLLGEGAIIDAKPQLEIFADDVKCTHGAAIGELDPVQFFYLKSRGLGEDGARRLLTRAFANEIILNVPLELLRFYLEKFPWTGIEK